MLNIYCRLGLIAATLGAFCTGAFAENAKPHTLYNSLARSAPELNPLYLKVPSARCSVLSITARNALNAWP